MWNHLEMGNIYTAEIWRRDTKNGDLECKIWGILTFHMWLKDEAATHKPFMSVEYSPANMEPENLKISMEWSLVPLIGGIGSI